VWTGAENPPAPGLHPRTVQLVASRYTDYTIPAHDDDDDDDDDDDVGFTVGLAGYLAFIMRECW
jgi:hypothetical protein